MLDAIGALKGQATVFLSSHILADVQRVASRVAIIAEGRLLMERATAEVLNLYAVEQYVIRVGEGEAARATELLGRHEAVRDVESSTEGLVVTSHPGQTDALASRVIPDLWASQVTILEFMRRRVDLEDVFFRVIQEQTQEGVAR